MNTMHSSSEYRQTVRELSDQLVEAQRELRILDAIKWGPEIQVEFFKTKGKELPKVDAEYYKNRALGYDTVQKRRNLAELERKIVRKLGEFSLVGLIMRRMCREYQTVVRMIEARGSEDFSLFSQELYGSAADVFHAGDPTLADLGSLMSEALENIDQTVWLQDEPRDISGEQAVEILQQRMHKYFQEEKNAPRVILSDGIVADAAAGADYLKIRKEAMFNRRDLDILEVHEGWVHLGTTINGMNQSVCSFLSKGPPSATTTQEGLAVFMEIICMTSYPARLKRITNRIRAVSMAEQGADFIEVYNFFKQCGYDDQESYTNATRVFRGSAPNLGPFTKDLSYSKGFILIYNYIRLAVRKGMLDRLSILFCGKTRLEDMGVLAQLVEEGLVEPAKYLPPQFADLNGLTAWMCYSNFLNKLSLKRIEADYSNIL